MAVARLRRDLHVNGAVAQRGVPIRRRAHGRGKAQVGRCQPRQTDRFAREEIVGRSGDGNVDVHTTQIGRLANRLRVPEILAHQHPRRPVPARVRAADRRDDLDVEAPLPEQAGASANR